MAVLLPSRGVIVAIASGGGVEDVLSEMLEPAGGLCDVLL